VASRPTSARETGGGGRVDRAQPELNMATLGAISTRNSWLIFLEGGCINHRVHIGEYHGIYELGMKTSHYKKKHNPVKIHENPITH